MTTLHKFWLQLHRGAVSVISVEINVNVVIMSSMFFKEIWKFFSYLFIRLLKIMILYNSKFNLTTKSLETVSF